MTISKNTSRILEVTDFKKVFFPPTLTLKLKLSIDSIYTNMYIDL